MSWKGAPLGQSPRPHFSLSPLVTTNVRDPPIAWFFHARLPSHSLSESTPQSKSVTRWVDVKGTGGCNDNCSTPKVLSPASVYANLLKALVEHPAIDTEDRTSPHQQQCKLDLAIRVLLPDKLFPRQNPTDFCLNNLPLGRSHLVVDDWGGYSYCYPEESEILKRT